MPKELLLKIFNDLQDALKLLESSVQEYAPFDPRRKYTASELKTYDALSFRFEKNVELFFNFFRTLEQFLFKDESDTLRNRLLKMHKIELIEDLESWMLICDLRNKIAHAYAPDELLNIYKGILNDYKILDAVHGKIELYLKQLN